MKQFSIASLVLVLACGDNRAALPDAARADAPPSQPDATVCTVPDYPQPIRVWSVDLGSPFDLTLDGNGTRCDQIIRALTDPDPHKRPPELAMFDVTDVISSCKYDAATDREIVRLRAPLYAGLPLFSPVQDVVVHIGKPAALIGSPATVVFLHGDFLPVGGPTVAGSCYGADRIRGAVGGQAMTYAKFDRCQYTGDGAYAIASDDVLELGDEGYLVDAQSQLRRVRGVDVYLLPGHVTDELANSDAFCCVPGTLDHCVGQRLFVDVVTGEIVQQAQHCHSC